jgi:transketolase
VLITKHLHYDFDSTENPSNDHLLFSKRHASPLLYGIFRAAGLLEGHPTPVLPWVEEATASWARACGLGWAWRLAGIGSTGSPIESGG